MSMLSRLAVKAAKEAAERETARAAKPMAKSMAAKVAPAAADLRVEMPKARKRTVTPRATQWVRTRELPASVKSDITDAVASGRLPAFSAAHAEMYGAAPRDADVAAELFEPDEVPFVAVQSVPISQIKVSADRQTSPSVVAKYASMPADTAPPLLVARTGNRFQLLEGGHRLAAAQARGDADAAVVDAAPLLDLDWQSHMDGSASYAPPAATEKARGGLAVKRRKRK